MTSLEAYKRFQLKLNSLTNSDNVDISPGEFVLLYNEQQNKWYESKFKGRSTKFVIDDVQTLASRDTLLTQIATTTDYTEYDLPDDYLDYINSHAIAEKEITWQDSQCVTQTQICTRRMRMFQVMLPNKEIYFRDQYNNPSFDASETFITVSSDRLQVYKTDFTLSSVFLTYYRYPKSIDIAGYTTINQTPSTTIDPELVDEYVNEIIDWCATDVDRIFKDPNSYSLSVDRLNRNTGN